MEDTPEVSELKKDNEKQGVVLEYSAALVKLQQVEDQVEQLRAEKSELLVANEELNQQLDKLLAERDNTVLRIKEEKNDLRALIDQRKLENENLFGELQVVNSEVGDLKQKLGEKEVELQALHTVKRDMQVEIEGNAMQVKRLSADNLRLEDQVSELKNVLREKEDELSTMLKKAEENETESLCRFESLTAQMNEFLHNQKCEHQIQMTSRVEEISQLRVEKEELEGRHFELEKTIQERGIEFSALQENHLSEKNKFSAELDALTEQVNNLQQEKSESLERVMRMETEKIELLGQISHLQALLKTQEDVHEKLNLEYNQVVGLFGECKSNLESAEAKIQELTETLTRNCESQEQIVADFEDTIQDLKRDVELRNDEVNTWIEKVSNLEVKLRLSNQKLRVTDQLLSEKEQSFREAKEKFEQELKMLQELVASLEANNEAQNRMLMDVSKTVQDLFSQIDALEHRFERSLEKLETSVLALSGELRIVTDRIAMTNKETAQLKEEVADLSQQLLCKTKEEATLKEMLEKLELKAGKQEGWNENLTRSKNILEMKVESLEKMVKEKDDGISNLGEEKREAIRQLCLWIEYHTDRYNYLKEALSKMRPGVQRAT